MNSRHEAPAAREGHSQDEADVHAERESGTMRVNNRRVFVRVNVDLEVSLGVDTNYFTARCVNLCPGGLLISTFHAFERGFDLSIEFELPASRVVAQGILLWAREATDESGPCYGIAFTELARFDRTLIEAFCATLAPDAYPRFPTSTRRLAG